MRRNLLTVALSIAVYGGAASLANAAEATAYTPQAFEAAQKSGEAILVEITAPWCPTCKAQKPILGRLEAEPKFKALHVFEVDFDTQKDAVKRFDARMQSTLITFKGSQEVARSVGDTKEGSIKTLLDKAI